MWSEDWRQIEALHPFKTGFDLPNVLNLLNGIMIQGYVVIPEPISRHLSPILLLMATRLLSSMHTGLLSFNSTLLFFVCITVPIVAAVPIFSLNDSLLFIGSTFIISCVPTAVSKRLYSREIPSTSAGSLAGKPTTDPINESLFTKDGSRRVPIATNPPGLTLSTRPAPVPRVAILDLMGSYLFFLSSHNPGLISISSPVSQLALNQTAS